ncbi:MAG: SCO family protein, partial [Flavobacteriales bacterium]
SKRFQGKIYIANFFFTTCRTICPKMTKQFQRIQKEFENNDEILLLSHTVDPKHDTAEVLKEYAKKHNAIEGKWIFATGNKEEIYDLARKSYFTVTSEGDGGKFDFIHTENFVLIDKKKRIRGFYDGTSPKEVDKLIRDIKKLLN